MAYMNRNVNFILLLLIVALVAYIIGLTNYYQATYKNLTVSYTVKVRQMSELSDNLTSQRGQLNRTYSELQLRVADKTRFDAMYTELTSIKTQLEKELATTKGDLSATKTSLAKTEDSLSTAQQQLTAAQLDILVKLSTISSLREQIDGLEASLASLRQECGAG